MRSSSFIDNGSTLDIADLEIALYNRDIISLLRRELPGLIENTTMHLPDADTAAVSDELRKNWVGEFNEAQPGRSARKWGIHNNGLCLLISLCVECLTQDL